MRAGVPVFIRPTSNPSSRRLSVMPCEAASPARPPSALRSPQCINPLRKVPAVRMTASARNSTPIRVRTPTMRGEPSRFSMMSSFAASCQIKRLGVCSNSLRHSRVKSSLSHCARGLHIAAPFERLSIRNWMVERSVMRAIQPPRASISRTICPFATPPTAGLHDIEAIFCTSIVSRSVREPRRAAAEAASQPAWPAPMTMMS